MYSAGSLASATALTLAIQLQLFGTGYRWLVLHSCCSNRALAASPAALARMQR